jgi:hypothetical protein
MLVVCIVLSESVMAIEQPSYQVSVSDGSFELRQYAPYLLAETRVEAGFMDSGNVAFGRLFRYISGANTAQTEIAMTAPVEQRASRGEKIAMTAPVEQSVAADGGYFVGFVVPSKYSARNVPQPTDPRVSIRAVPARRVAVWRYSGRWTEENFRESERQLREALRARGIPVPADAQAALARYDAPFKPGFMRRNEVHIELSR